MVKYGPSRFSGGGVASKEVKEPIIKTDVSTVSKPVFADIPVYDESPREVSFLTLQRNLEQCLQIVDDEVMKGYVASLRALPVARLDDAFLNGLDPVRFFRITKLVYQEKEFTVDKLSTVFHSLSNKPCTLVLMIRSDGQNNEFYLGVRSRDPRRFSTGAMKATLERGLLGQFPGSDTAECTLDEAKAFIRATRTDCVSSVTGIADYKRSRNAMENAEFIQGFEKIAFSMQGTPYTAVFIANNVSADELSELRREYERIYTQLSPFANMQYNFALNRSASVSASAASGQTRSVTRSDSLSAGKSETLNATESHNVSRTDTITDATGKSVSVGSGKTRTLGSADGVTDSVADTHTEGKAVTRGLGLSTGSTLGGGLSAGIGFLAHAGLNLFASQTLGLSGSVSRSKSVSDSRTVSHATSHTDSISDSISRNLSYGLNDSHAVGKSLGTNEGTSLGVSQGRSLQIGRGVSDGESASVSTTTALSNVFGDSQAVTLNAQNKALTDMLQRLEKQLQRIEQCESFGMWDYAAYFLGESAAEGETAANLYYSLTAGEQSGLERSAVNTWMEKTTANAVSRFVLNFLHPVFLYERPEYGRMSPIAVDPSALSSTTELAIQMGLPRRSVKGLPVVRHVPFGREVLKQRNRNGPSCRLGVVDFLGKETKTPVDLDLESLSMHTLITGSTGAGKSNAVCQLLNEVTRRGVRFLIVEPAKGEYKHIFGVRPDVSVYGTNPNASALLRINPFSFPDGVHIYEHLDRLIEIFNVCWPMYAAMPAILKDAIERAYVEAGWDLKRSRNRFHRRLYPDFSDALRQINIVMNQSQYADENKANYKGALCARLNSLTNGINGLVFVSNELSVEELFNQNVIVDLSRCGSHETKALIMGLLIMKLQEYRISSATEINHPLRHITVLEEAHHLLKRTSPQSEGANLLEKSVEMLTNSIAEMRTYGEGFVIADQSPGLLDVAVIRNTNTKIIMRLPEYSDRELVGRAAGLHDDQLEELSRLERGVAAVYQNDWIEATLCKVDLAPANTGTFQFSGNAENEWSEDLKTRILKLAIRNQLPDCSRDIQEELVQSSLPLPLKRSIFDYRNADAQERTEALSRLMFTLFDGESWLTKRNLPSSYDAFKKNAVYALTPSLRAPEYDAYLDYIMSLLLYEASKRYKEYIPLWDECTRRIKGGVLA